MLYVNNSVVFQITDTFVPLKKPSQIKQVIQQSAENIKVTYFAVCEKNKSEC